MLTDISSILLYLLVSFLLTFLLIPPFLQIVYRLKLGKQIRDNALTGKAEIFKFLHNHKAGTPTMGASVILTTVIILVFTSAILWYFRDMIETMTGFRINNSLWSRQETYLAIFTLFSLGAIGFVDDLLNIKGK